FFSSRRQHTRSKRDCSSDVCSSDLLRQRHHFFPFSLPISLSSQFPLRHCHNLMPHFTTTTTTNFVFSLSLSLSLAQVYGSSTRRSEERRVGKECVTMW